MHRGNERAYQLLNISTDVCEMASGRSQNNNVNMFMYILHRVAQSLIVATSGMNSCLCKTVKE